MTFLHRRELFGAGFTLMGRLPGLIGHAVDGLAAFVLAHVSALGVGLLLEPVGQAVAAEAREIHQIDVLDIGTGAQMFDQAPEDGGFKFRSGFVVNGHDRDLAVLRNLIDIRWELSQILPYRSAKQSNNGRDFGCLSPENATLAVDIPRSVTRNRQYVDIDSLN